MEPESRSDVLRMDNQVSGSGSGSRIVDQFSLVQGGPICRLQLAILMDMPDRLGVVKRAFLTILLTWFPLVLVLLFQGRAWSQVQKPFLHDLANSFSIVREMKVVLIDKNLLLGRAILETLPMFPLIIFATSADQLIRAVLKVLL